MSDSYLNVGGKRYWSVASVERGLTRAARMLRERGLGERLFIDAFNAELGTDDPTEPGDSATAADPAGIATELREIAEILAPLIDDWTVSGSRLRQSSTRLRALAEHLAAPTPPADE